MNGLSRAIRTTSLVAVLVVVAFVPRVGARGKSGMSHSGGHHAGGGHAGGSSHHAAPHRASPPHKAAHHSGQTPKATHHANQTPGTTHRANHSRPRTSGNANRANHATHSRHRRYAMRNRAYSQGNRYALVHRNTRSILNHLRSAQTTLGRTTLAYRGHRIRAMHAIRRAIRQVGHTSIGSRGMGLASPRNLASVMGVGNRRGLGARTPTSRARSDALVRRSMRSLHAAQRSMTGPSGPQNYTRAQATVQGALRELTMALRTR